MQATVMIIGPKTSNKALDYGFLRLQERFSQEIRELLPLLQRCPGPSQQYMAVELLIGQYNQAVDISFRPQARIEALGQAYPVDFEVELDFGRERKVKIALFCGEPSGLKLLQDFRLEMDRNLQAAGYLVIRFSEREISQDPKRCFDKLVGLAVEYLANK